MNKQKFICKKILYSSEQADTNELFGKIEQLEVENAELRVRLDKLEKAGEILQRDLLRVFSTSNERVNELLTNIWDMAKLQAEKELKGEKNDI